MKISNLFLIVLLIGIFITSTNIRDAYNYHNNILAYQEETFKTDVQLAKYISNLTDEEYARPSSDQKYIRELNSNLLSAYSQLRRTNDDLRDKSISSALYGIILIAMGYEGWKKFRYGWKFKLGETEIEIKNDPV